MIHNRYTIPNVTPTSSAANVQGVRPRNRSHNHAGPTIISATVMILVAHSYPLPIESAEDDGVFRRPNDQISLSGFPKAVYKHEFWAGSEPNFRVKILTVGLESAMCRFGR